MLIDMYPAPNVSKRELTDKNVVVIDTLRATSTIVTAIANGCREVIPVSDIPEATGVAARLGKAGVLMCGERGGLPITGFDLSNSPLEFTQEKVAGKTLIMTTTNGTQAINSMRDSKNVLIGSFLNAQNVANMLMALGGDSVIVCAGTAGKFSLDDILAAGAIIDKLFKAHKPLLCDLSMTALKLYRDGKNDLHAALSGTFHYERLKSMGLEDDLDFCLRLDVVDCMPMLFDGVVKKAVLT